MKIFKWLFKEKKSKHSHYNETTSYIGPYDVSTNPQNGIMKTIEDFIHVNSIPQGWANDYIEINIDDETYNTYLRSYRNIECVGIQFPDPKIRTITYCYSTNIILVSNSNLKKDTITCIQELRDQKINEILK